MAAPALSPQQEAELFDELASALEEMVDRSCAEMAGLWSIATRDARANLGGARELKFEPDQRYLALGRAGQCKYRSLAAWRHAMIWQDTLARIEDADLAEAVRTIYFTPYPDGGPPYAWSRRASQAPGAHRFASPNTLKFWAKEGCWHSVAALRAIRAKLLAGGAWPEELRAMFLRAGTQDTLRDVLKLEDHPEWEVEP